MILQRYESVVMKNMMDLETKKEQEIKNMVTILEQIDLPDIILLTRDANTLLMRQKEAEAQEQRVRWGKMRKKEKWVPFPERHPWLPVIISIIALIAAYTKG